MVLNLLSVNTLENMIAFKHICHSFSHVAFSPWGLSSFPRLSTTVTFSIDPRVLETSIIESLLVNGTMTAVIENVGNALLFLLVFGMSATVDTKRMLKQVKNRKAILTGKLQGIQHHHSAPIRSPGER